MGLLGALQPQQQAHAKQRQKAHRAAPAEPPLQLRAEQRCGTGLVRDFVTTVQLVPRGGVDEFEASQLLQSSPHAY